MTLLLEKAGIGHWVTGQKRKTKRGNFSKFIPIDCDAFNAYHDLHLSQICGNQFGVSLSDYQESRNDRNWIMTKDQNSVILCWRRCSWRITMAMVTSG